MAILLLLVAPAQVLLPPRLAQAAAGIAFVQKGTEASQGGTSITATLPAATVAGDLLVATTQDLNSGCGSDNFTAPAGWVAAAQVCRGATGPLTIWYRANTAAGITSVAFNTGSSGANSIAQLSEWSGVAISNPLDQIGTMSSAGSSTSLTVTTSGAITASGELGITAFDTSTGLSSLTAGSGWTSLRSDPGNGYNSDYRIGPTAGSTLTEGITSNPQTNWAAVIATFTPGCSGGSQTVKAPPTLSFPSVALNAYDRTVSQTATITADDETGSGGGWNVTATSTTFNAGSGKVLPATATRITGASVAAAAGNCSTPTNSVSYPVTLPAGPSPPTATRVYNAAANTGKGPSDITLTAVVTLPANTSAGTYTSTWTLTIASGP